MKVLVFGTGGVGSIYAYFLEKGGADVTAVCRSNFDAVTENGITVLARGKGELHGRPRAVRTAQEATANGEVYDFVLVTAKSFAGNEKLVSAAVSKDTVIVLGQNGIDIEPVWVEAYPNNTIVSGVVYLPTTQISPGVVKWNAPFQELHIGTYPASAPQASKDQVTRLADVFKKGGGEVFVHDDIQLERWRKLMVNASWNPMTALSRLDDANFLRSSPIAEDVVKSVMIELASVAKAAGYAIPDETIEEHLDRPRERLKSGGKEPSMLTDVRENRPLEVEAIVGNTVRIARRLQVDTPRLDLIYALAQGLSFSIVRDDRFVPIA